MYVLRDSDEGRKSISVSWDLTPCKLVHGRKASDEAAVAILIVRNGGTGFEIKTSRISITCSNDTRVEIFS
jgi:hypothetical protein